MSESLRELGQDLMEERAFERALAVLAEAVRRTPADHRSRMLAARAFAGLGERESVAVGLQRTGRIVTYAALLFCIAIGAFATSEVIFVKQVGVGTALAVLIDAFLVRALLVPSLMALLGRWNWWAPRPLARLHARMGLQEA